MGDRKNEDKQHPGYIDQEKKREDDRAGRKPRESYEKDQASNPERREGQDPQYDPSHIQEDSSRDTSR